MLIKSAIVLLIVATILDDFLRLIDNNSPFIKLEIVVLSSLSNFHKRQAIRETWGKSIQLINERFSGNNVSICIRFVVGNDYCRIHPINRIDPLDCETLKDYVKTNKNIEFDNIWNQKMEKTIKELQIEALKFGDIEFVKMIDVYRNLPEKLLLSFKSLIDKRRKFTHLLKTDDDCYINISSLIDLIQEYRDEDFAWFGNFRKNWAVNHVGKWKDDLYSAIFYPEFACGSGYVLTRNIVEWINKNAKYLKRYQGEDVSMGIWLEPLKVKKIQDKRFICGEETVVDNRFLAAPQLLPEMMNQIHERILQQENHNNCT